MQTNFTWLSYSVWWVNLGFNLGMNGVFSFTLSFAFHIYKSDMFYYIITIFMPIVEANKNLRVLTIFVYENEQFTSIICIP